MVRHTGLHATWQADVFSLFESHLLTSGAHHELAVHYPCQG
jgi:hypothetical protein